MHSPTTIHVMAEKKKQKEKKDTKNTSLRLDREVLKALKRRAIDEETSVQKIVDMLIRRYLDGK
jgi:hypothetical protein